MSANSDDFIQFVIDQFSPLNGVESGRFFGGNGLSYNGIQFAMMMGNSLFFVVDNSTRQKYKEAGSDCFSYNTSKKRVQVHKYYEVPAEILEDQDLLLEWARESIDVTARLSKKK